MRFMSACLDQHRDEGVWERERGWGGLRSGVWSVRRNFAGEEAGEERAGVSADWSWLGGGERRERQIKKEYPSMTYLF